MISVVLGRYRWQRRRALARAGFAEVDAFGRPTTVFLTDSQRKADVVASTAIERTTFEPDTRVVARLLGELWSRFGDGRAPLARDQAVALALPIVRATPMLAGLGSPVSTARHLVELLDGELRMGHRADVPQDLRGALGALDRACSTGEYVHLAVAHRLLAERLRAPGAALERWLRKTSAVVVDDLVQLAPGPLEALLSLLSAWSRCGVPVALSFATGNDLGPEGLPAFFGAGEPTWDDRGFAATHRWRRAVFERFVAEEGAELLLAGPRDPLPLDLGGVVLPPDPVDRMLAGERLEVVPDGLDVTTHPGVGDEVRWVIREVVGHLERGAVPESCWIAVTDPAVYRHVLDAELARAGLLADRGDAPSVLETAAGQVIRLVLREIRYNLDPQEWLALAEILGHPIERVRSLLSPAGVHRGPPGSWRGRILGHARRAGLDPEPLEASLRDLEALRQGLVPPDGTTELGTFVSWFRDSLATVGLRSLAASDDLSLRVLATVDERLDRLVIDTLAFAPVGSAADLATWIGQVLGRAVLPGPLGRVPVTGVLELRDRAPRHTWILGATRGRWPAPLGASPLIGPRDLARLAPADRLAEARYTLLGLVRECTGRPADEPGSLSISWPESIGGRPTVVSRVVAELLDGLPEGAVVAHPPTPARSRDAVPCEPRGTLPTPPARPDHLGVTAAETAMQCPARFWYRHVLTLRPEDPWDPELEPRRRGTALHRIFQELYEARQAKAIEPGERDEVARVLHGIATRVLDEVEAEGGFEPTLQAWARSRWLAGLIDEAPLGLLGAWLRSEIERGLGPHGVEVPVRLEVGATTLVGKVDRVDRIGGLTAVVDYKTGKPPRRDRVEQGLALQPLVYLEAVAPAGLGASAYQLVGRPDAIRFAGWFGDAEAIRALGGSRGVHADADARRARLGRVAERLDDVLGGAVHTTEWGEELGGCPTCDFRRICRVKHDHVAEPSC